MKIKQCRVNALSYIFVFMFFTFLVGCQSNKCLEPHITYSPSAFYIKKLPSPFPPLTQEEFRQSWGKELLIATSFAAELDFYRAITSYKRARFLVPETCRLRILQMEYGVIEAYYFAEKYEEVIEAYDSSMLIDAPADFPALDDLLIMLYDAYERTGNIEKASHVMEGIELRNAGSADRLQLSEAVREGDLEVIGVHATHDSENDGINQFLVAYECRAKSVRKAENLNAILPGAGYYYVGQKQTAFTSFCINALFIASSYLFIKNGNIPAGVITGSLELGWYFGGINGAGLAAKEYNDRIYDTLAKELMLQQQLFPVLMLKYGF